MTNPPAPGSTGAPAAIPPPAPAGEKVTDLVAEAVGLGRQVAHLYVAVADRFDDGSAPGRPDHRTGMHPSPPATTAGLGPLDSEGSFELRLLAVRASLHHLSGSAAAAGLEMPTVDDLVAQGIDLFGDSGCQAVGHLHAQIIETLTASMPSMGSAYELGTALAGLCEATCKNASEFQAAINAGRIDRIRELIGRLNSLLPPHAAKAVTGALNNWEDWLAAGTIGGRPLDWNRDGPQIALVLSMQGSLWFSLLTGQKAAEDLLSLEDYVSAGEGLVGQYRHLGGRFLAQWWPGLVAGLVVVAALVGLFLKYGNGSIKGFGTIATLLAGIGVTTKTVTSTLEKTASDIGNTLWEAELDKAIILATTTLPAGDMPVVMPVTRPLQHKERMMAKSAKNARQTAIAHRTAARAAVARGAAAPTSAAAPTVRLPPLGPRPGEHP